MLLLGCCKTSPRLCGSQGWTSCPSEKDGRWWRCSCKDSAEQAQGFGLAERQDREQIVGTGQCFLCYETLIILNLHVHHGELGCASQVRARALLQPVYHHAIPSANFFRPMLKPTPPVLEGVQQGNGSFGYKLDFGQGNVHGALCGLPHHSLPPCRSGLVGPSEVPPIQRSPGQPWAVRGPVTLSSATRRRPSSRQGTAGRQRRPRAAEWGRTG